jgi:Protein of unknown function (DUF2723)
MNMSSFKTLNNIAGWLTFAIAAVVLAAAAQPTGSLWDCGEFIAGAYKLQVVHPPGAPIFLLVGRLFTWVASIFSKDPATIAYSVNLLSALCTAFTALFVCWSTTILARLIVVGRGEEPEGAQSLAVAGAGIVAGLAAAFTSSIWFSAVEGEVYAMSTFFTAMTLWAVLKWYNLPDTAEADRWLVFAFYSTALSIGVHLLSLLTFPALAMFYYFKKSKQPTVTGTLAAAGVGMAFIIFIQKVIIAGIPGLWASFDKFMVNSLGMPYHTGLIPVFLLFGGAIWYGLRRAQQTGNGLLQRIVVALGVTVVAYMSYGIVVLRATANTPINMNDPSDAMRLLPYLNREQYGERPLLRGPHFDARPIGVKSEDRYGRVGDRYEIVEDKTDYKWLSSDQTLFPRMGDNTQGRPQLYRRWIGKPSGTPTLGDNISFFVRYQLGWMYFRYFMWNFAGRQNGEQGMFSNDPTAGHWISGIDFLDEGRVGNQAELPDFYRNHQARNTYFMIPALLGLLGMYFHYRRRPRDFAAIMALFIITGIGIIVYSNQPPSEPRERDYVLAGSFFTYCIWIGLSVVALFDLLANRLKIGGMAAAPASVVIGLVAPLLMVTQNWDDHSRARQYASRDYARNFLESCDKNAIIFTYGDNDTYPLWYCQEVENIRTDVRVVNLSLIATDWYIYQLRRAMNDSPAIDMSIPEEKIRGFKRMQIYYNPQSGPEKEMNIQQVLKFLSEDHPLPIGDGSRPLDTYLPTRKVFMPVNKAEMQANGLLSPSDSAAVDTMRFTITNEQYIIKDQLALIDIIATNINKRPIYWAVTCREDRLLGMQDYLQLEGLSLRIVPVKSKSATDSYGMIGCGRVNVDVAAKNILEKWKWGNFDKERQFVDKSFTPSLQTMRIAMLRIAREALREGKKDLAIQLADKQFEVFPDFNFIPDRFSALTADVYAAAENKEKAGAAIRNIAKFAEAQMKYYQSQPADMRPGFRDEEQMTMGTIQFLMQAAENAKDEALIKELETQFEPYMPQGPALPGVIPQ